MSYKTKISGVHSLKEIELAISGEEATGAEFVESNIAFVDGAITNIVTFNDLAPGNVPSSNLVLLKRGDPSVGEKSNIWTGVMLVNGSNQAVSAYRS